MPRSTIGTAAAAPEYFFANHANAKHSRLEWAHFPVTPCVRRLRERMFFMITGLAVHGASLMLTLIALYWIFRRE